MNTWLYSKEEEDKKILENMGLVGHIAKQFDVAPSDFDDIVSQGTIGLIKAVRTFDESKSIAFATYATVCIRNEILMYLRHENKHANYISLDEPIINNENGNELTLSDIIPISNNSIKSEIEEREIIKNVFSIILNLLSSKKRLIMLYRLSGETQNSISKILNISQSYISRIEKNISSKIKESLKTEPQFKEVFSMIKTDNLYELSFSTTDVTHFNQVFSSILQNYISLKSLPSFKVIHFEERVVIQTPADNSSFYFIAKFIQEIENFTLTHVSKENTLFANDKDFQTNGSINSYSSNDIVIDEFQDCNIEKSNSNHVSLITFPGKRGSKARKVMEYICSHDSFTVKELTSKFPDISYTTINGYIFNAKMMNLIVTTGRGKYKKTKN